MPIQERFDLDVSDPPLTLYLAGRTFKVPFWKLYYDLKAIDAKYPDSDDPVQVKGMVEEYRQYLVQIGGFQDGQVGLGDATAFHRKYWMAFNEKKTLADGQRLPESPSASPATPANGLMPNFQASLGSPSSASIPG